VQIAAIAGASGIVGRRALHHLLARSEVARVVAVGRRTLPVQDAKLESMVADLRNRSAIISVLPAGLGVAICCLGTTLKQAGSKDAFRSVDHDAVLAFAEAALERGAQRFVLVSSLGADPRARNFYLRTKGETEEAVGRLGYRQLTIVRPSFIDDQGARSEYRPLERLTLPLARAVFSIVGRTTRYSPVSAELIGKALVHVAFDETTERVRIVESEEIHTLGL
jgi:uncharacterized protein YbjT (DUF2867 family)